MKKYFDILGLQEGASQEAIQEAFDRLSIEIDPKKNENQEFFLEEFEKLQEAYKVLRNSSILSAESKVRNTKIMEDSNKDDLKQNQSTKSNNPIEFKRNNKSVMKNIVNQFNGKFIKKIKCFVYFVIVIGIIFYSFFFFQTDIDSLVISSSNENTWSNSVISNEVVFTKKDMKPFTGNLIMFKNNYSGKFKNGKKVGIHREYYSFNKLMREGNYRNGIKEGIHQVWSNNGQLICKVNYKNGKRFGLSKKWNDEGQLIALDFNENQIGQYISYYFKSKKVNPIEGYYFPDIQKTPLQSYYNLVILYLDGFYYAIMTNNYKSENDYCEYFVIGDVKAIISNLDNTKFNYRWFMCDRKIENGIGYYSLKNKTLVFTNEQINYKKHD